MVLDDVAHGAGFLVERPAGAHAYVFGDRDLDVVDVVLVPDRLEDPVGEPQGKDVLDRLLAEVVVDAVDLGLIEVPLELRVELLGTPEVPPERLLYDQPRPAAVLAFVQPSLAQVLHDGGEERRRRREVEGPVPLRPPLAIQPLQEFFEFVVGLRLLRVAGHVEDAVRKGLPDVVGDLPGALLLQRLCGACSLNSSWLIAVREMPTTANSSGSLRWAARS